jgi:hypothetical protein
LSTLDAEETTKGPVLALASAVGDDVLVGRADGLVLLGADGSLVARCTDSGTSHVATLVSGTQGRGVAVLGSRDLVALSFDQQSCTVEPVSLLDPAEVVLGVAVDSNEQNSYVVGLYGPNSAQPTLARLPGNARLTSGCSILGLVAAGQALVVLDPVCRAVHFFELDTGREPYRHQLVELLAGRALTRVPESPGTQVVLGTVNTLDGTASLWVLGVSPW